MIYFIALKKVNPNGQLDEANIPCGICMFPVSSFEFDKKVDKNNLFLICNQLSNIDSIMELASSNLIDSSGNVSQAICEKLYSTVTENLLEKISIDFLLNSILYYNASFDYLRVILKYIYSSYEELIGEFPRKRVEEEMQYLGLTANLDLALGSCITKIKIKDYFVWIEKSNRISEEFKKILINLKEKNNELKNKHQANQLKHGSSPHFRRTNPANAIGAKVFESLEQFYNKKNLKNKSLVIGVPENTLQIDEVQNFLIDYHNFTVKVINIIGLGARLDIWHSKKNGDGWFTLKGFLRP